MSEWWTYRPSDLLMFSARSYARLVEQYQRELWPLQLFAMLAGLVLLWLAVRRPRSGARRVAGAAALAWLWVGWAFHLQRHTQINTAATALAVLFALEAALLLGLGAARSRTAATPQVLRRLGLALAAAGVLLYPLLAWATGRPWHQAEVFGAMPDPTALTTLGLLLATDQPYRRTLCVIPVLALVYAGTVALLLHA